MELQGGGLAVGLGGLQSEVTCVGKNVQPPPNTTFGSFERGGLWFHIFFCQASGGTQGPFKLSMGTNAHGRHPSEVWLSIVTIGTCDLLSPMGLLLEASLSGTQVLVLS